MEETRRRYLNYALSVITSRALPDVRDGLKPVQRRILYGMFHDDHVTPDNKYKKCAKIVGTVMGTYHPHGDSSIYEALVRMAQDWTLRGPLVNGQGNFGSLDGDSPAAQRYTEAKLLPLAMELLVELRSHTVEFRPTYDGTTEEPIVLPARFPQLLVNGCTGIAVGMATSIPPHNLGEVTDALLALIDEPQLETKDLLKHVKGPDFPTAGWIVNSKAELREIYETGNGAVKVRGEWKSEEDKKGKLYLVITSIPYMVNKATLVEEIAQIVLGRKVPQLLDVRDESTTDIRVVCEVKKDADLAMVAAYLYKHTALQQNFNVNITCLVPTENPQVQAPEKLDLKKLLRHFLDFRLEVVTRRFQFQLDELAKRIHILEAFEKAYDVLDELIRLIRKSDGKEDAARQIIAKYKFDEEQTEAILELKLYRLAKLEILAIQSELKEKAAEAGRIGAILKSEAKRWGVVKSELAEVREKFADKRRTRIAGAGDEPEFDPEAYIVQEDVKVLLSRDGWVKRVREIKDLASTRLREGDSLLAVADWLDQGVGGVLLHPRRVLRDPDRRHPSHHRLRGARPEAVQVRRRRRRGGDDVARSPDAASGGLRWEATADGGQGRRHGPAISPRAAPRGLHPFGPPLCQGGRGQRGGGRDAGEPEGRLDRGHPAGPGAPLQGQRDQRALGAGQGRDGDQGPRGRQGDRVQPGPRQGRRADPGDRQRQDDRGGTRQVRGHRAGRQGASGLQAR